MMSGLAAKTNRYFSASVGQPSGPGKFHRHVREKLSDKKSEVPVRKPRQVSILVLNLTPTG